MPNWLGYLAIGVASVLIAESILAAGRAVWRWLTERTIERQVRAILADSPDVADVPTDPEDMKRVSKRVMQYVRARAREVAAEGESDDKPEEEDEEVKRREQNPQSWYS